MSFYPARNFRIVFDPNGATVTDRYLNMTVRVERAAEAEPQVAEAQPQVAEAEPQVAEAQPQAAEAEPQAAEGQLQAAEGQPQAAEAPRTAEEYFNGLFDDITRRRLRRWHTDAEIRAIERMPVSEIFQNPPNGLFPSPEACWPDRFRPDGTYVEFPPPSEPVVAGAQALPEGYLPEGVRCAVCWVQPKTMVFLPCKHCCTCEDCSTWVMEIGDDKGNMLCPVCRTEIRRVHKVFM